MHSSSDIDWQIGKGEELEWTLILPRTKLGPHRQHYFQLDNVHGRVYTHVKVTIHPDGGIKRIRIIGTKASEGSVFRTYEASTLMHGTSSVPTSVIPPRPTNPTIIPVLPLTPEAFAPFGQVIQAYADHNAVPKGTRITPANQGSASKFHKLSLLDASYPVDAGATAGISVYRCNPLANIAEDSTSEVKILERHPFTNQAFVPMGGGPGEGLRDPGQAYLVVVAKNAADGGPDPLTLRAFVASAAQGIVYDTAVWRKSLHLSVDGSLTCLPADQPMTALGKVRFFGSSMGAKSVTSFCLLANGLCLRGDTDREWVESRL